ncbi:MAG TPA: nucleoside triphosphate pyrophosphohydrolase [Gemmatimonadales bacterium]|nr:nucleoside triphosphate pyrophosphohydrolase [Gemmatimonadales bacterium]
MQEKSALARAMAMVSDLRQRCSWDRVQTRETLRPYLVEEALELDHALGTGNRAAIREEVSDLLLHLAWQFVLAEELGEFTVDDVAQDLETKMRRRHPHLFELGPEEQWERLKRAERRERGTLEGLPPALPDLLMAFRIQERAAGVGFDWPDVAGPLAKVQEELEEVRAELAQSPVRPGVSGPAPERLTDEIGDLLFAVVNLARKAGVAPGHALDRANQRFRRRFRTVEQLASERGIDVHTAGLAVLDEIWEEAKRMESAQR